MLGITKTPAELENISPQDIPPQLIAAAQPVILRRLVADWPLVKAGRESDRELVNYLTSVYNGRPTIVCKLSPEKQGRLFYNHNYTQLDYHSYNGRIDEMLEAILAQRNEPEPDGYYIASNIIDSHFPGLLEENTLQVPRSMAPSQRGEMSRETVSIWLGTQTTASCHFDALDNIACCVAGRRRFILFPPDQVENLYPGPLEPTPGGQVISLVDFERPDYRKYPRFKQAVEAAMVVELAPGDAVFLPSMWWHHVVGLARFNVLVNYWWNDAAKYLSSGMNALYMAMLGIRDKPEHERKAWQQLFDYYIFSGAEKASAHLPPEARGFLEKLDNLSSRKLRALLLNKLNR